MLTVRVIDEQIPIIIVEGEVDVRNKKDIVQAIDLAVNPNNNQLILDVTGVRGVDTQEMQAIIEASHRTLGAGGRLAIVVTDKEKAMALRRSHIEATPGVVVFESRNDASMYMGNRGKGVA